MWLILWLERKARLCMSDKKKQDKIMENPNGSGSKTSTGSLQTAVLCRTLVPMMIMVLVIAVCVARQYQQSIIREIENSISAVAASVAATYDEIYPGDYELVGDQMVSLYKGEQELTGQYGIVDRIAETTNMEVSLFYGNTRILTTLQDADGNRYIATGLNAAVLKDMQTLLDNQKADENLDSSARDYDKLTLCYQIEVDGVAYYACYYPLCNSDKSLVGLIGVAKTNTQIRSEITKALWPLLLITLLSLLITGYIIIRYTRNLILAITKIQKFLHSMTKGELSNELDREVLKRQDELGAAGKDIVEMQNAIRTLVETDVLTNLYNRRMGGARFRKLQAKNVKKGVPFAIALGDIDFFKKVNDTYGHDIGDLVLKQVALVMRKGMTGHGFVARWGGEEFLLVFDKTNMKDSSVILQQILEEIRKISIDANGQKIHITMTFGIVDGSDAQDYCDLIKRADEKLYYGKENGRNRVITELSEEEAAAEKDQVAKIQSIPQDLADAARMIQETKDSSPIVETMIMKMSQEIDNDV